MTPVCTRAWDFGVESGEGDISESQGWMPVALHPDPPSPTPTDGRGRLQTRPDSLPRIPGTGWWFCQMKTKRGWVPASYLEPLDSPDESEDPEPNYEGAPPSSAAGVGL